MAVEEAPLAMVTANAEEPPEVVVKNGVWPLVPTEVVERETVTAVPVLETALPYWSWTWTTNGPTVAVLLTVWLPDTVLVKVSLLAAPATMVNPLVVPLTEWPFTVAEAEIVGLLAKVSE